MMYYYSQERTERSAKTTTEVTLMNGLLLYATTLQGRSAREIAAAYHDLKGPLYGLRRTFADNLSASRWDNDGVALAEFAVLCTALEKWEWLVNATESGTLFARFRALGQKEPLYVQAEADNGDVRWTCYYHDGKRAWQQTEPRLLAMVRLAHYACSEEFAVLMPHQERPWPYNPIYDL